MQKFIVSGVGRSGTTAMAESLNLHPNVFCAIEQADEKPDHTALLDSPESILTAKNWNNFTGLNSGILAKKDRTSIRAVGNKFPGYVNSP